MSIIHHNKLDITGLIGSVLKFCSLVVSSDLFLFLKVNGGREGRPIGAYELAKAVEELGAGEILLNCIDCDGEDEYLLNIKFIIGSIYLGIRTEK